MDTSEVTQLVAERGRPEVVSLSEDTHVFHFDRGGFWEESPILFVNRNGHHFRVIEQTAGDFLFAKTWNGMFDTVSWQIEAQLRRPDPAKLINLCGIGPQGRRGGTFESLCLLPRDATAGRRKACWRQHLIDVHFERGTDTFSLLRPGTDDEWARFEGKLWESTGAEKQAREWLGDQEVKITAPAKRGPLTQDQSAALEANPLWGMF